MERIEEKNSVKVSGRIVSEPVFSHEVLGEKFYAFSLEVKRPSGNVDYVPVIVSEKRIDIGMLLRAAYISVYGSFRSYNKHSESGFRLILNVFASRIEPVEAGTYDNEITIVGYICKEPTARITPLGKEITDVLIAVNRSCGNSDYIPCIAWGKHSRYAAALPVGSCVRLGGRIQSREYVKKTGDTEETRTAYEVSANYITLCE